MNRFCFIALIGIAVPFEGAAATLSTQDLDLALQKAKSFFSHKELLLRRAPTVALNPKIVFDGYFDRLSNRIDVHPRLNSAEAQVDLVHELTHAIRAQVNPHEALWLDEGLAKFMEYKYSTVWPKSYSKVLARNARIVFDNPGPENQNLFYGPRGDGYAFSFWLVAYLQRHFGGEILLKKLLTSPLSGWENVTTAISQWIVETGSSIPLELVTKESLLRHFAMAVLVNDPYAAKYGLFFIDSEFEPLKSLKGTTFTSSFLNNVTIEGQILFSMVEPCGLIDEGFSITELSPLRIQTLPAQTTLSTMAHGPPMGIYLRY